SPRQAAPMGTITRKHESTGEVHSHGSGPGQRKWEGCRWRWKQELVPSRPTWRQPWNEQDASEHGADTRAITSAPAQGDEDQEIDRGVLEEVDAIGEQRHRADG